MDLMILERLRMPASALRVVMVALAVLLAALHPATAQESRREWRSSVTDGVYSTQVDVERAIRTLPGYENVDSIKSVRVSENEVIYEYWAGELLPSVARTYFSNGKSFPDEASARGELIAEMDRRSIESGCAPSTTADPFLGWQGNPKYGEYRWYVGTHILNAALAGCWRFDWNSSLQRNSVFSCSVGTQYIGNICKPISATTVLVTSNLLACDSCSLVGNPIDVTNGNKLETEVDFELGWIALTRYYHSALNDGAGGFGYGWTHSHAMRIVEAIDSGSGLGLIRENGTQVFFRKVGAGYESNDGTGDRILIVDGGWQLLREGTDARFDAAGRLIRQTTRDGRRLEYERDALGRVTVIGHSSGRTLEFEYAAGDASGAGEIEAVSSNGQRLFTYTYSVDRKLEAVIDVRGVAPVSRRYHYEDLRFPSHLTGITDENGNRFSTFTYDDKGRALSSEHAGGVNRTTLRYSVQGGASVTDALGHGSIRELIPAAGDGRPRKLSGITESRGTRAITYNDVAVDFRRRVKSVVDYDGTRTDHAYGEIAGADGMPAIRTHRMVEASGTSRERATEIHTHIATNAVVMRRTAGREVWITRNARSQPTAILTIDPVANQQRLEKLAYCETIDVGATNSVCPIVGLLKSIDGSRTDVADVTTFAYHPTDASTCATAPATCTHRKGDLWKVTNALGQVTETLRYDGAGRPLSMKDANGVITDLEYHPRGWLVARKVRGADAGSEADDAITRIEYSPTGLVRKVIQPDGAFTAYTYDAAHRLTGIGDNAGNTITYTLDYAGNRIKEDTKGSSGTLVRTLSRVHDQLGQLSNTKDAANRVTAAMTYDAVGNTDTVTDALGTVTDHDYDPLNRLTRTLQDVAGIKAETKFQYDALDQLTQVTDPKGLNTKYEYDGLGNLARLTSPDTGITSYTYDAAGNRLTQTDARSVTTSYGYDALNRLTAVRYPTSGLNVTYDYDQVQAGCGMDEIFGAGRMTRMTDASGYTQYCHDRRGNVARKIQISRSPSSKALTTRYAYTLSDRLGGVVYPSGMRVDYVHNANGQPSGVGVTQPGQPTEVLLAGVSYHPFGPASELQYGNGRLLKRSLNLDYQPGFIEDTQGGGLSLGYEFDANGNMVGLRRSDQADPALRQYRYDALGRLAEARDGSTQSTLQAYAYDATGNRSSAVVDGATTPYAYSATDHKLQRVGTTERTYDAAGNTLSIGGESKKFVYNDAGRMSRVQGGGTLMHYIYNGKGEQVSRTPTGTFLQQVFFGYDEAGHVTGVYNFQSNRTQEIIWLDDLPIGVVVGSTGKLHYIQPDHLGTPRAVVDPTRQNAVWTWALEGDSFGTTAPNQDADGDGQQFVFDLRYPGQRFDAASGLNYNYFRDYEAATGRYSQSDPIGLAGGLSSYGYVEGSPHVFTDTLGLINDNRLPSQNEIRRDLERARERNLAMAELRRTYGEMLNKSVRGTDQFFHCLAACRGVKASGSPDMVLGLMGQKEVRDYMLNIVGQYGDKKLSHSDMMVDIGRDLAVNEIGASCPPGVDCLQRCRNLLNGLAPRKRPFMTEYRSDWSRP